MKKIVIIICLISFNFCNSQVVKIKGIVIDKNTLLPIPYVTIYNITTKQSTKCNIDGQFEINTKTSSDSVVLSSLGYKKYTIELISNSTYYEIMLEPYANKINQVIIKPTDNSYLYDIIDKCKNNISKEISTSKAYYELKSFVQNKQIELIESYYNIDIEGYNVKETHLKAGRIALQKDSINNRYFTSQESSKAIVNYNLFEDNSNFPINLIQLNSKKAKKKFYLDVLFEYINSDFDSILVLKFKPKKIENNFFEGTIWINKSYLSFERIVLNCHYCNIYPFKPLRNIDKIDSFNLNISFNYKRKEGKYFFNEINFTYDFKYIYNFETENSNTRSIYSKALFYTYENEKLFVIPKMDFSNNFYSKGYNKIYAYPFNAFFWNYNNEDKILINKIENDSFFNDLKSLTNKDFFNFSYNSIKLFENPFIHWGKYRINFVERIEDRQLLVDKNNAGVALVLLRKENQSQIGSRYHDYEVKKILYGFKELPYTFSVKYFIDINSYNDSIDIFSKTIFDPNESYYYLKFDLKTRCFVNMYFDLCEINRIQNMNMLRKFPLDSFNINSLYKKMNLGKVDVCENFLKAVNLGNYIPKMKEWNNFIKEKLGIDNIDLFKPYYKENEK